MEILLRAFLVSSLFFEIGLAFVVKPHHQATRETAPLFAKKKKGKKSKDKKKGGFEWAASFTQQPFEATQKRDLVSAALASFKGRSGKSLSPELDGAADIPKAIWNSPEVACMVVSQSEEGNDQPVVEYANIAALETVGLKKNEFEQLFSTKPKELQTADDIKPAVDAIQLDLPPAMKGDKKFERGYKKKMLRQEEPGDVTIVDAYRWDVEKSTFEGGKFVTESIGVGYAWGEWLIGEHLVCSPGGVMNEIEEELGDLKKRIADQGTLIRDLKENEGLGNKDPQVVEAVAELLRLKSLDED
mmetsp:Transcript_1696/g.2874  ORF Transcript_1696/g.2874 Transcript_1696/m.2874 type:complete len:301 (+) Transcript_1696:63-965(+)